MKTDQALSTQAKGVGSTEGLGHAAPKREALSPEALRHALTAQGLREARRVADALLQTPIGSISCDDLGYAARIIQRLCLDLEPIVSEQRVSLLDMLREARDFIDTLPSYPKGADLCDRIDALCGPNAARA